jgi:hypothetical protein
MHKAYLALDFLVAQGELKISVAYGSKKMMCEKHMIALSCDVNFARGVIILCIAEEHPCSNERTICKPRGLI